MKDRLNKILGFLLTLAIIIVMMPGMSLTTYAAEEVKYLEGAWDDTAGKCILTEKSTDSYTVIASNSTAWANGVTYVVDSDVNITDRITVTGTVNLILCDGATLTASNGITVSKGNTLNIYGQKSETGTLTATAYYGWGEMGAAIGGYGKENDETGFDTCGTINIHGGMVNANRNGDSSCYAAGIGGAGTEEGKANGGTVTVYYGTVNANGSQGPGIGDSGNPNQAGGTFTMYGGTVTAVGGEYAGGISGGNTGYGTAITAAIYGGTLTATGSGWPRQNDNYRPGDGIGYGSIYGDGTHDHGTLTAGKGVTIQGSSDNSTWVTLESPFSTRYQYMKAEGPQAVLPGPASYTISYNLNGGTTSPDNPTSYTMSDDITLNNPTRTGYEFTGWTGSNGDTPQTSVTLPAGTSGDKGYTANWNIITYTISFDLGGGKLDSDIASYDVETSRTIPQPTRTGYDFDGWLLSGDTSGTLSIDLTIPQGTTGNREYVAKWTAHVYTISYNLDGGTVSPENPTSYTIESTDIHLNRPSRTGYDFTGWTGTGLSSASMDVTIPAGSIGDRSYTATWKAITYTISYDLNGGSVTTANPTSYDVETTITLTNPSRTGYEFTGWSGTGITGTSTDVKIPSGSVGNRSYTATWTPITYTISYTLNNGNVSGNPTSYTIESDTFTLNNPTKNGYQFDGWTGTDLSGKTQTVTIHKGQSEIGVTQRILAQSSTR